MSVDRERLRASYDANASQRAVHTLPDWRVRARDQWPHQVRMAGADAVTLWQAHCRRLGLELFEVRRADIEGYARQLETEELAPGYGQSAAGDHHRVLPVGAGRGAGHGQPGRQRPQATAR